MRRLLALVLVLFGAAACDSSTEPEGNRAAGTYTLETFNGSRLPATVFQDVQGRIEVTAGTLVLRGDRSYTETFQARLLPAGGPPETDQIIENGTYAVAGSSITFTVPAQAGNPAFSYTGTLSGNVLTYSVQDVSVQYRRQ